MATDPRPKLVLTGIAGRLGRLLARRLHRDGHYHVVGIDRRSLPGRPPDVEVHEVDLRSKRTRDVIRRTRPKALVHLGLLHDPHRSAKAHHRWNVEGTARLLDACAAYAVPKVVFLSTHTVYGARAENPQFLTEEAPLLGAQDLPQMRDLVEADMLVSSFFWKHQDIETVILRPVHILGRVSNAISNYLRLDPVPRLLGFDPMMQVIHEEDVVAGIVSALRPEVRGIFNLPGPGEIPLSVILRELGRSTISVPHFLAPTVMRLLWKMELSVFQGSELNHLRYVCMVDGSRARRELGFEPRHTLRETILAVDDGAG